MTNRTLRVALLLLFLAAMGATAYLFWIAERDAHSTTVASRRFDDSAHAAQAQVADLRAAQQAYVAAGQGEDFWFERSSSAFTAAKATLTDLRSTASSTQCAAALDEALGSLSDFEQMDGRARDYARTRQATQASDLIFSDGFDLTRKVSEAIDRARSEERVVRDAQIAALDRRQAFSLGAAAAASLLIVLLLVPTGRDEGIPSIATPVTPAVGPRPIQTLSANRLDAEGWSPAKREKITETSKPEAAPAVSAPKPAAAAMPAPVVTAAPAAGVTPAPAAKPRIDLQQLSAICGDLARVVDTRTLPSLLERAADVLDAGGIVLWVADPDGRELAPIITHGYPQNIVVRLGMLPRDAENATAAAFRTSLLQTVKTDAVSNGAIAAPLVAANGCVGVMAAEVRHHGEEDESVLAAAAIFAAQLATLVGPPSTRAKTEAAV